MFEFLIFKWYFEFFWGSGVYQSIFLGPNAWLQSFNNFFPLDFEMTLANYNLLPLLEYSI